MFISYSVPVYKRAGQECRQHLFADSRVRSEIVITSHSVFIHIDEMLATSYEHGEQARVIATSFVRDRLVSSASWEA
jgi:hypothetical protein